MSNSPDDWGVDDAIETRELKIKTTKTFREILDATAEEFILKGAHPLELLLMTEKAEQNMEDAFWWLYDNHPRFRRFIELEEVKHKSLPAMLAVWNIQNP